MPQLNDLELRRLLIHRLATASRPPRKILEEVRVHNGNAIADVVALHQTAHCYEIKGDNDSIQRAQLQGKYYDLAFKKVSLVTTARQLTKALEIVPKHWGILVATAGEQGISLSYARAAAVSPLFDKKAALLTLWRSELEEVALGLEFEAKKKMSRDKMATHLAKHTSQRTVAEQICAQLYLRHLTQKSL